VTEAADEYRQAESRYDGHDVRGKEVSMYGRAHVLAVAGRCAEAREAYVQYAAFVEVASPEKAAMARRYADDCIESLPSDPAAAAIAIAVVAGDYTRALALAPEQETAWLDYNRAVALARVGRTDEAIASFRRAERAFADDHPREKSIAMYGRARALTDALRCTEAKEAFAEYAAFVRATNPHDADMALIYARDCSGPFRW
jgi:tetratricopeptide (TPR) repeat protein